ncbi:hypothetical protein WR25_06757 [Diploscapter pachys]|uniref:Kinetochore protein Nuf2 N-terminal domain-containing protein n=1 Tax=Diploscapter pachys TaxID=2018661 RepID=A0A2A2K9V5_9BILA|nr:hypothetical protein WR25_06757 [Diploscapter pachys]
MAKLLDARTIVHHLSVGLRYSVTDADVNQPRSERIQSIYHEFAIKILGVPESSFTMLPTLDGIQDRDPDLHRKSDFLILLYTVMSSFFEDFGSLKLSMCDLVNPNPKNARNFLACLADFVHFYKFADDIFTRTQEQFAEHRKNIEISESLMKRKERDLDNVKGELEVTNRRKAELDSDIERLAVKFNRLYAEESTLREEIMACIAQGEKIDGRKKEIEAETESTRQQIELLSEDLMPSAREVRDDIEQLRKQKMEYSEMSNNSRNVNARLIGQMTECGQLNINFEKYEANLQKLHKLAEELKEKEKEYSYAKTESSDREQAINELHDKMEDVKMEMENGKEKHELAWTEQKEFLSQMETKKQEVRADISRANKENTKASAETRLKIKEVSDLKSERSKMQRDFERQIKEMTEQVEAVILKHNKTMSKVTKSMRKYATNLNEIENAVRYDPGQDKHDTHDSNSIV